jgi:hypothetical protein
VGEIDGPVRLGLRGLRDAVARFGAATNGLAERDEDGVMAAVAEAAMWACALDQRWWKRVGYEGRREGDPDGRLLPGLRWARNQGVHQLVALHRVSDRAGMGFPLSFPMSFGWQVTWLSRDQVPEEDRIDERLRAAYDEHLAGRPVRGTLEYAVAWCEREAVG